MMDINQRPDGGGGVLVNLYRDGGLHAAIARHRNGEVDEGAFKMGTVH